MGERVNPDMIVLAREARRMSQRELAEESKISQQRISKYENGLLEVSRDDLESIAIATRYRPSLFRCTEAIVGLGSSMLFNRKRETTPVTTQKEIQAKVNITRFQLSRLLRSAQMETAKKLMRLDIESSTGAAEVAQRLRAAWNLPLGPVQNVTALIEAAGGLIVLCDFGTDQIDGAHLWLDDSPPMFFMNANVPGDRHRFNLAHELGHAVMHHFPTGDIEAEANEFASEFLLPSQAILPELSDLTMEKLGRLKQRWKVSMAAIIYAAHRLGCMSDHKYRMFYARLNTLGYRRNEPIAIQVEQPTLVRQLLEIHRDGLNYSDEEMRDLLMTDEPDFIVLPNAFRLPPPLKVQVEGPLSFEEHRRKIGG